MLNLPEIHFRVKALLNELFAINKTIEDPDNRNTIKLITNRTLYHLI